MEGRLNGRTLQADRDFARGRILWGLLFGSAMFATPGIGPLLVAGPLVAWIVDGLEVAAVVGGLSALDAGLASIGIPKTASSSSRQL